jgi:hypothetical protein
MTDPIRQRVLDAVARGEIRPGSPSHLRALDFEPSEMRGYWERWNQEATARIKAAAARPACICAAGLR